MTRELPVLELSEWESGWAAPISDLTPADRDLAAALREADGGRLMVDERRDGVWVSAKSWVGVVRFSAFEIRVVPKLAGGNLGVVRMLDYASGIAALRRYEASRELETIGDDLVELIAWLFADAAGQIVRDGLLNDYVGREDTLHALRGRLRLLDQAQRRFGRVDPLEVAFDDFVSDIPENQIIAAALDATRPIVRTPNVQRAIRRLHAIFHEACEPGQTDALSLLNELAYTRRNKHYANAHQLARLLLRRLAVRDLFTPGGTRSFAFLLDMNALFELFVGRLASETLQPLGIHVHSQRSDRSIVIDEATNRGYAAIIPDLLLEGRSHGRTVRLPVDTKYKLYDRGKIQPGDVYQTFFYAFAYAAERAEHGPARAVILYPRAGEGIDTSLRVETYLGLQNARIQAFGIDVDAALRVVSKRPVSANEIPAMKRLYEAFREVLDATAREDRWRALPA